MEAFTWWNKEHTKLASEVREFVNGAMPRAEEAWWKREFPRDIMKRIAEKGYFGAGVPKDYGGMGYGATGACIAAEEIQRMPGVAWVFISSILGGLHQITRFGTEKQKGKFLPRMAKGELGAIAITEPFVGTDAAGIETTARRKGDKYIISGKKRFIIGAGVASRYMLYARTSDKAEDVQSHRHLTAFMLEKGMPGFTVEKINEIMGYGNVPNGYLNLDEVTVPAGNRIGEEGQGWGVMTGGLNYERVVVSAQALGLLRHAINAVVSYGQRRVQFGRPTIDIPTNQFKVADMISKLKLARLATYYAAHLLDIRQETAVECSICKVFNTDALMETCIEAIQLMGGDGTTKFYPLERIMNVSKVAQIAGGTNEAIRLTIYRMGLRQMAEELRMRRRTSHDTLGVPITRDDRPAKRSEVDEESLLAVLAENYRVNPGLHMTREDLEEEFEMESEKLDRVVLSLEKKKLVKLLRKGKDITLARITYEGLKKAKPAEYYQWFPPWVSREDIF
jgi:alkylation response protein AidB-like acyl-CoA dehydrogenase